MEKEITGQFEIVARDAQTKARRGVLHLAHGDVETPVFMPVGTQATVKALESRDLLADDAQIILSNTYHLFLRPGAETIAAAGGLHRFMGWEPAFPETMPEGGLTLVAQWSSSAMSIPNTRRRCSLLLRGGRPSSQF